MMTGDPVTVHRYATDRYGDRVEVSQHSVGRTAFGPRPVAGSRGSAEFTDRANTVTADAELYAPYEADITSTDVIEMADGTLWEVAGSPERWRSPFTHHTPGMVVPLRRKTG